MTRPDQNPPSAMHAPHRIGIDLGGTKCAGALFNGQGREIGVARVPTPREDYDGTVRIIADVVGNLEARLPHPATVGVGMPGTIDPRTRRVKNCNATWIQGRDFQRDLEQALARPVRVANDGHCFTVAEARDGAARGASVVFGATLGTGCGGGIVVNGTVLTGNNGISGEWGHFPLPWADESERTARACFCGKMDCIERYLSGGALAFDYREASGKVIDARDIPELLDGDDPIAERVVARYEDRLARALALVVDLLDPDIIVLGGGVSNMARLYENVPPLMAKYVFADRMDTPVVKAVHGDASGVRGAAWLWTEEHAET